ncbi:MAG: PAS domain-containing sensor histidine kinase [Thiothrix sp.]|nr:MAG: PAS domain-containing sensor histidine kinase [Thiothrix sp.]
MPHKKTRSQLTLEHMDTAVLEFNHQLELVYMNPSAETLTAKSFRQIQGQSIDKLCQPESQLAPLLKRVLETDQPITRRELELQFPSGNITTTNITISPIPGEGILIEIQSVGRLYTISQESRRQKEYTTTLHLLRGLAHEIKNPLGGIRGAAQLLEAELENPEYMEYTNVIIKETDRLQKLIDQMGGPKRPPQKQLLNIHEVTEHVFKLISAESTGDIVLKRDYDPSLPMIKADKDQLIQAVLNVARNALESLKESKGVISFKTRSLRKYTIAGNSYPLVMQLTILDDGPGIPEDLQAQIFFPMVSNKPAGTGLGLPIAQSLINANGGLINFQSSPGQTCFDFLLPFEG